MEGEDSILRELHEQTKWLRLLGLTSLRSLVSTTVQSDRDRLVFDLSDGLRSTRDIAKLVGVSQMTVSRLWQDWLTLGICTESRSRPGRAEKLLSLAKLGIQVPKRPEFESVPSEGASAMQESIDES